MLTPEVDGGGIWAILAALLPALVLLAYVFWYGKVHPEPVAILFKGFVCGIVSEGPDWSSLAAVRAVLSVPAHYIIAVVMGYFYSVAKYKRVKGWKRLWQLSLIWIVPVLIHGTFDAMAMNMQYSDTVYIILVIALFLFCYVFHKLCNHLILELLLADCESSKKKI